MDEAATVSQTQHQVLDVSTQLTSQVDPEAGCFPLHGAPLSLPLAGQALPLPSGAWHGAGCRNGKIG